MEEEGGALSDLGSLIICLGGGSWIMAREEEGCCGEIGLKTGELYSVVAKERGGCCCRGIYGWWEEGGDENGTDEMAWVGWN